MRLHDAAPRWAQCCLLFTSVLFVAACSSPMQSDGSNGGDASDIVVGSDIASDSHGDGTGDVNTGACAGDLDCNDMVFCNGAERCMPGAVGADGRGCVAAPSQNACLPGQTCNEAEQRCVTQCMHALDADGDGHRAADCGGDDCADDDPNRFPGNPEVCDAMDHDEDCDAMTFGLRDTDNDSFVDARCCNADSSGTRHCGDDCNDSRPNVHPGLAEACDGLDNNCDMQIDEGVQRTFHADVDDDGYGVSTGTTMMGCNPPAHYAESTGDCDDANSAVHPGALEQCDGAMVDENCDGMANPAALCTCSGDISRACATAAGACAAGSQRCIGGSWGACSITPVPEICNGIDDDCDGTTDEMLFVTCYPDADNDGYPATGATSVQSCPVPGRDAFAGCPANQTNRAPNGIDIDCNDSDSTISPGQPELCDSTMRDENCDGAINPPSLCMCAEGQTRPCTAPGTCGAGNQTCSAGRFSACSVNPVAESCNAIDDDCDGMTDEGLTVTCYIDRDNDGYAATGTPAIQSCPVMGRDFVGGCPTNQTNRAPASGTTDCNDMNAAVSPAASELCDTGMVDENCDGMANPTATCACSGTASRTCMLPGACAAGTQSCSSGSWGNCSIAPITESCNSIDDDCDGMTDEGTTITCYPDADNDGYAAMGATSLQACSVTGRESVGGCPVGNTNRAPASGNTDCNDSASSINPGAPEQCDAAMADENCDGTANPSSLCMCSGTMTRSCTLPGACAAGTQACQSGSWGTCSIGPVPETCNGTDDNCNGMTDEGVTITCYPDVDNDGYAATGATPQQVCAAPGRSAVGGCATNFTNRAPSGSSNIDCNDSNGSVNPAASEQCDAAMADENCDGTANPASLCTCSGTGTRSCSMGGLSGPCASGTQMCSGGSWQACTIQPQAETCNAIDDDCDGMTDETLTVACYLDPDNDGYAAMGAASSQQCPIAGRETVGGCPTGYTNRAPTGTAIDCDGMNSSRNPGATETCNTLDDNCNGTVDEGVTTLFYRDADGDGFGGTSAMTMNACTPPTGFVNNNTDCNDSSASVRPGGTEICNGIDDNCNGTTDEGVTRTFYRDSDSDGYGNPSMPTTMATCAPPAGYVVDNTDCNDACSSCHPGGLEICDGNDQNCNSMIDEGVQVVFYRDQDGDGFGLNSMPSSPACSAPSGYVANNTDCNDATGAGASIHPGATEVCNTVDDNCNSMIDEGVTRTFYRDADGDGYGTASSPSATMSCAPASGYVADNTDCNDTCNACHPGGVELCDMLDNNCVGGVDEGVTITCYTDGDNDSYPPMSATSTIACPVAGRDAYGGCPAGRTNRVPAAGAYDCNDANGAVSPGASEQCDAAMVDENCDGMANPAALCACSGTGTRSCMALGACAAGTQTCSAGQWTACSISATTEVCNGVDDDCDGTVDDGVRVVCYADNDGDSYGAGASSSQCVDPTRTGVGQGTCPVGFSNRLGDCLDFNAAVRPGATETCNGIDDNCSGAPDEGVTTTYYRDVDGDGYGLTGTTQAACSQPAGYATVGGDCNDANNAVHPGVAEICNGAVDDNCNGSLNDGSAATTCYPANASTTTYTCSSAGACVVSTCAAGWMNCSTANPADGCETRTDNDPANCGGCGVSCGVGGVCTGGVCDTVTSLDAGYGHICALRSSGNVVCWGRNDTGQLGDGTTSDRYTPVRVLGLGPATAVTAGGLNTNGSHTCAMSAGRLYCWGANVDGRIGEGDFASPVLVPSIASNLPPAGSTSTLYSVTAGEFTTCALTRTSGGFYDMWCWGDGTAGGLATGNTTTRNVPTAAGGASTLFQIAAGENGGCGIFGSGSLQCWGAGGYGQLGNNTFTDSLNPVTVMTITNAVEVGAGDSFNCARLSTGSVNCWGNTLAGRLGNGVSDTTDRPTPVAISGGYTDVSEIAIGGTGGCIRRGGRVMCWGLNFNGEVGNGTTGVTTVPTFVTGFAGLAGGMNDAVEITHGTGFACLRRMNNDIWCWGSNAFGQLGNGSGGSGMNSLVPVQVSGL